MPRNSPCITCAVQGPAAPRAELCGDPGRPRVVRAGAPSDAAARSGADVVAPEGAPGFPGPQGAPDAAADASSRAGSSADAHTGGFPVDKPIQGPVNPGKGATFELRRRQSSWRGGAPGARAAAVAYLEDCSTNGTFLNGERVPHSESAPLRAGDRLSLVLSVAPLTEQFFTFHEGAITRQCSHSKEVSGVSKSSLVCSARRCANDDRSWLVLRAAPIMEQLFIFQRIRRRSRVSTEK